MEAAESAPYGRRQRESAVHNRFTPLVTNEVSTMRSPPRPLALATASLLLLAATSVPPDRQGGQSLREAVERNEIVPLKSIMDWIEEHYRGQVVEVELENEAGDFRYEIDLLTPEGSKIEFVFDARSGELRSVTGKDIERARRR